MNVRSKVKQMKAMHGYFAIIDHVIVFEFAKDLRGKVREAL